MALRKTPDADTRPEPGSAAQTPEEVNDRADAAETAATRPLTDNSMGSAKPLDSHDRLDGTEGVAAENDAASEKKRTPPKS